MQFIDTYEMSVENSWNFIEAWQLNINLKRHWQTLLNACYCFTTLIHSINGYSAVYVWWMKVTLRFLGKYKKENLKRLCQTIWFFEIMAYKCGQNPWISFTTSENDWIIDIKIRILSVKKMKNWFRHHNICFSAVVKEVT